MKLDWVSKWLGPALLVILATVARAADAPSSASQERPRSNLIVFNDNGAWCWFQDERAIIDPVAGKMLIGSVADASGPGGVERNGNVEVTTYDLKTGAIQRSVLHEQLQDDDHDVPALWIRPDGRYLACYGKHNTDKFTRWRLSAQPHDSTQWEPEEQFNWSKPPASIGDNNATYANLHYLGDEKRLYNFVRAVNRDHSILCSTDDGATWEYVGKLLLDDNVGYVNGYVKYASDGKRRIDFITTEHHPRDFNNSIYHAYVEGGKLHKSDGTVVDDNIFDTEAPKPVDLTRVFAADTAVDGEVMTRCWTTDLAIQPNGNPYAIFTCRANDPKNKNFDDHRFFYARYDGSQWQVHQLAKAGAKLWLAEQDYTGGAAVDPTDPNIVYISTPIDPREGTKLAHHEIYKGVTGDGGTTWAWSAITQNSTTDNLRPIVPQWDKEHTAILWFRGKMDRSQDFDTAIVGIVEGAGTQTAAATTSIRP